MEGWTHHFSNGSLLLLWFLLAGDSGNNGSSIRSLKVFPQGPYRFAVLLAGIRFPGRQTEAGQALEERRNESFRE